MKNIIKNFKIDTSVYLLLFFSLLAGFIKQSLIIIMIVLIHELGHIFFCKIFKIKITSIKIYPFGGITKSETLINYDINKEIIIYLGGFLFQIIFGLIAPFLFDYKNLEIINYYNKLIILFNIIPIIPLDGSMIIRLLLQKYISFKNSYKLSIIISVISIILLIILLNKILINNLVIIIFLITKIYEVIKNFPYIFNKFLLERHLYNLDYDKIIYIKDKDLNKFGKNKYYYVKNKKELLSEKKILREIFDRKQ